MTMKPGEFLDLALDTVRPHLGVTSATFWGPEVHLGLEGELTVKARGGVGEVWATYHKAAGEVIAAVKAAGIGFQEWPTVEVAGDMNMPRVRMRLFLVPAKPAA